MFSAFGLLVISIVFFLKLPVMAQDKNEVLISVSTSLSCIYGGINEYVFDETGKASELDWQLKPLFLAGTTISVSLSSLKLEGSLSSAINEDTGNIKDYDWDTATGVVSNYSEHNIKQKGSIFSDVNLSYDFFLRPEMYLFPCFGVKYNNIQLTAEDGYLEYPPGSAHEDIYGKGIIYEQKYFIPYIGAGISYNVSQLRISGAFLYSSYLQCAARDSHVRRDLDFYDEVKSAEYINMNCSVSYCAVERTSFTLSYGWTYIPLTKGRSYYIDLVTGDQSQVSNNGGGIKAAYSDVTLSVNFYL